MAAVKRADVVTEAISVRETDALVTDPAAGAIVSFSGDVRDHDHGKSVQRLEYEAHPSAGSVIAEVANRVVARHDVIAVAVLHRVGPLQVGESALVASVSAAHRSTAFSACADLVDETKKHLPIWKHQVFTDGTDEWVNCA